MATPDGSPAVSPATAASAAPLVRLPLVTINDLLWLLYLYPVRWLARVLPRWSLYAIGKLSDPIVQFQVRRRKARAVPWIAQACGATPGQASRIASRSVSNNMFRALDELLLLRPASGEMLRCSGIVGIENLDVAIARGKGVILLTGHFFANRIAGLHLAANGYAVLSVHNRRPSNKAEGWLGSQFLQPRSIQLQESAYPDSVYIQDPDCSLKIMRRLRAGGLVIFKLDGRGATKVIEQILLGVPWGVPSGIFEIIRLSDCAVVPMLCLGRSSGFRIRFDPMLPVDQADSRDEFVSSNLPRFLAVVEKQITENPDQWRLWNHY